jgi:hypothetical protein
LRVKFLTLIQIEPSAKPAATQTIQAQPTPQIKPQPAPQVIPEIKIPNQQLTNNAPPTPPSTPAPTPVPAPIASVDMNNLDEIWNKILEQLKENRILYNMLVYAKITQIKDGRLCLRLKETSFTDFVTKQKEFLEGKIKLVLNKHLQLEVESGNKTTQENAGAQTDNAAAAQQEKEMIRTRKINEIIEIFEGTVL